MANEYLLSLKLQQAIDAATALEANQAQLNSLIGEVNRNTIPSYPLPRIGKESSLTNEQLRGLLYGGENIGGQIMEYIEDVRQSFEFPANGIVRYAIIYPEHSEADTVKVGEWGHLVDVYASEAVRPKVPVYGRKPIKISGGKNLLSFGLLITEPTAKFNILFFG